VSNIIDLIERRPGGTGLQWEEAQNRLSNGWQVIPGLFLAVGSPIPTPSQPVQQSGFFDVWIPPIGMIPDPVLVVAMLEAEKRGADILALETISARVFGIHYSDLKRVVESSVSRPDGEVAAD